MINEFMFSMGTSIHFGQGVVSQVGEEAKNLNAKKVMLVADKGVRSTGIPASIEEIVTAAGIEVINFDQIVANPRIRDCEEGAKLGLAEKVDVIVAVGGGSSMDTAKAIAGMIGHNTTNFDDIRFPKPYEKDPLPLIAIPTTAGTGSEVTICGVVTDETTHTKVYCLDYKCAPTVALADPELLMNLPNPIAASTGIDALTHAIEGYVAKCTHPITEAFGLHAIRLLQSNLRDYIYARTPEVCGNMLMGSMLAGLAFGYSDVCAVHCIAECIGAEYDTPHGVANAIFLADVCEYSIPGNVKKYVEIAKALGVKCDGLSDRAAAQAGVEEIRSLVSDLAIPKFNQVPNVKPEEFERIAEKCTLNVSLPDNPRNLEPKDFLMLLEQAYKR